MPEERTDGRPEGISLRDAYKKIRTWYQANKSSMPDPESDYGKASAALIDALPPERP